MRVFWESTTAQFGIMILSVAALAAGFSDDVKWTDWIDLAKFVLGFYATKEIGSKAATAYGGK